MNITVIHQYYLRENQAGGPRFNVFARAWADAGHDVTVIAGQIDYTSGEPLPGASGTWCAEEFDGPVRVLRAFTPRSYHDGYVGRAVSIAGFGASAAAVLAMLPRADVVVVTSPPLTVSFAAFVARARGEKVVFEVRDLWPESAVATGVLDAHGAITSSLYALESMAYKASDHIVALTPAIQGDILRRGLAEPEMTSMIPNGASANMLDRDASRRAETRAKFGWEDKFVVLYPGAHGRANALWQYVEAAAALLGRPDILLATIGDGPEKPALIKMSEDLGVAERMVWLDPVGQDEIVDVIDAADAGAAVLMDTDTFKTVYPNKVFDLMARGKPVVIAIDGVARDLVENAGAGVFVRPEHPEALASAIEALASDPERCAEMGRAGRSLVRSSFDRRQLASAYEALFERLRVR